VNDGIFLWIRVRLRTILSARLAMKILGTQRHDEARVEPDKRRSGDLRAEADHLEEEEARLRDAQFKSEKDDPQ
jgi:hypothetical protein